MDERQNYWTRRAFTMRRRRFLGATGALGAGVAGMALAGCGGDDDDESNGGSNGGNGASPTAGGTSAAGNGGTSGATGPVGNTSEIDVSLEQFREIYHGRHLRDLPGYGKQPQRGGTFRYIFIRPVSWDPTGAGANTLPSYAVAHNQLIRFKLGDHVENHNFQELEPDLAETMPEQPDELTYIFKLNQGVTFQDTAPVNGRPLTSEDIRYCIEAYKEAPVQSSTYSEITTIDTPDDQTVILKTTDPTAYLIGSMVIPWNWIFAREQHEAGGMDTTPIGTGPFVLESMEDQGGFVLARNPTYWKKDEHGTQLPYWDKVEAVYINNAVDADAAFRTGGLDHRTPSSYDGWKELVNSDPLVVTQVTTPPPSAHPFICMNLNKPPFDDVRVRRALALAVDRDALIEALAGGMAGYGYGMDQTYFGSEWPFGPEELGDWHHYDPEQAKQLLADAGYEDGIPEPLEVFTSYTSGLWFEVAVATMNMWNQIGIQTNHQYSADQSQWISRYFNKEYEDMMSVNFVGPGWDPDAFTYQALHSESPRNYFHVNNPDLDRLTLQQRRELDLEARQQLVREIMDIDLNEVYRVWLIMTYKINVRRPYVQNLTDTLAAWAPTGWGSHNFETGWYDEAQR